MYFIPLIFLLCPHNWWNHMNLLTQRQEEREGRRSPSSWNGYVHVHAFSSTNTGILTPPLVLRRKRFSSSSSSSRSSNMPIFVSSSSSEQKQEQQNQEISQQQNSSNNNNNNNVESERTVTILSRGPNHILALKPPSVVCHHSNWAGSRPRQKKKKRKKILQNDGEYQYEYEEPEIPMLQRVRDAIHSIDFHDYGIENEDGDGDGDGSHEMKRINLVHRLDRGASGVLLFAFANANEHVNDGTNDLDTDSPSGSDIDIDVDVDVNIDIDIDIDIESSNKKRRPKVKGPTAILQEEMSKSTTTKTYVALVRGEGILKGEDLKQKGWFTIDRPIKDEKGKLNDATTLFRFVASQSEPPRLQDGGSDDDNDNSDDDYNDDGDGDDNGDYESRRILQPRMSLVLARPQHGRWHQIRRHLNGLSHPILGDTSHGSSQTNREWKEKRNLPGERICLHLARLEMEPTVYTPDGIDCACPLQGDMLNMLRVYAPGVLEEALPVLREEGILIDVPDDHEYAVGTYNVPKTVEDDDMDNHKFGRRKSIREDNALVLSRGDNFVVVQKPPGVVVHNSSWTAKRRNEPTPMLQRVRDTVDRKVNPLHRLDRSASGCLVFAIADDNEKSGGDNSNPGSREVTNTLINAMQSEDAIKTYIALVDGDGHWNGKNFMDKGWFTINSPVKDEWGKLNNEAETDILFVAGTVLPPAGEDIHMAEEGRKVSIVVARPKTGKYHQIRQHLASGFVGHAILGDSSHGRSRTNRIWKKKRHLMKERTCLHLIDIKIPASKYAPGGIEAFCPLPDDLMTMLDAVPGLLDEARPTLLEEGIKI